MKTVLRITRHSIRPEAPIELPEPLRAEWEQKMVSSNAAQIAELQRLYGSDCDIVERTGTFTAAQVLELAKELNADVIEAVLPPAITADLLHPYTGFKGEGGVIRAVMNRVPAPFEGNEKNMVFVFEDKGDGTTGYYEKVVKVEVVTERL